MGATVVAVASEIGAHGVAFPIMGALLCLAIRLAALRFDLHFPHPPPLDRLERD